MHYLKAENDLPDIIVLDMNMPKMDGQTCLITIKSEAYLRHIPIAILSTGDNPIAIKTAYDSEAFRYFVKPFSIDDYRKIIQQILEI